MKRQTILTALSALLLGIVAVPALAQGVDGVGIDLAVLIPHKAIYFDTNLDQAAQPEELVGEYDVYNAALLLNFHWAPVEGATYYRVSLIQFALPGKAAPSPSKEIKIAHHSVTDPNGPKFSMSVGDASVCLDCVTYIQVVPETVSLAEDGVTPVYTPLGSGTQISGLFVLEFLPGSGSGGSPYGPLCGDTICTAAEANYTGPHWCPEDCQ